MELEAVVATWKLTLQILGVTFIHCPCPPARNFVYPALFFILSNLSFNLPAKSRLYKSHCPSVGPSVAPFITLELKRVKPRKYHQWCCDFFMSVCWGGRAHSSAMILQPRGYLFFSFFFSVNVSYSSVCLHSNHQWNLTISIDPDTRDT